MLSCDEEKSETTWENSLSSLRPRVSTISKANSHWLLLRHTVPKSQWHTEIINFFFLMSQQIHWCSFVISWGPHKSEGQREVGWRWVLTGWLCVKLQNCPPGVCSHPVLRSRMKHSRSCVKPSHGNSKGTKGKSKHTRVHKALPRIPTTPQFTLQSKSHGWATSGM